jgi:hypothetical protein
MSLRAALQFPGASGVEIVMLGARKTQQRHFTTTFCHEVMTVKHPN